MASNLEIKIWSSFGSNADSALNQQMPVFECVAVAAIESAGIVPQRLPSQGNVGSLGLMDIKRMDVKTAISMSLMEIYATTGQLFEVVADDYGGIEFVDTESDGGFNRYYYSVQTTSFNNTLSDVMVVGGKPLPKIELKPFVDVLAKKEIYDQQTMFENCRAANFYRHATIVYQDPQLDTEYEDGIDNLYEIDRDNPYEKLIGYVHYKNPNLENRPDVKIDWANQSAIPIKLHPFIDSTGATAQNAPYIPMGNLQELNNFDLIDGEGSQLCNAGRGGTVSYTNGVQVPIDTLNKWRYQTKRGVQVDNFIRISSVYIIGKEIELLFYAPNSQDVMLQPSTVANSTIWASINKTQTTTFKCEEGKHYAVAFDESKNPYIVFAKITRDGDPFSYGQGTKFRIDPVCTLARKTSMAGEFTGTVFPITKTSGILVFEIWVVADVETPCINVYDPDGQAHLIARSLEYNIAPMTSDDVPAPIATRYDGIIDQSESIKDNDPTTVQSFSNTTLESAMDRMQGTGMSVTWSFLDTETKVEAAANNLYTLFESQNNVVETVYTCGPNETPKLGAAAKGGYINAIRYSYTDQGSYTISVTVGPKLSQNSIVQVDGGPTPMMVEDVSAKGTIIQSAGDNINFKVSINGYGDRWAICMTPNILRVGDVVQCSVHNNPVEY